MKTSGNSVLITGGSEGIGLELAKRFVSAGNDVLVCGRSAQTLARAAAVVPGLKTKQCDITVHDDLLELVRHAGEVLPNLNILVNNAGIQYNVLFGSDEFDGSALRKEAEANFVAPLVLTKLLWPQLTAANAAALVNISSGLGIVPKETAAVYCGTKGGIHLFTKALRYQVDAARLRVFEIIPPLVDTGMTKGRGSGKLTPLQLVDEFWKAFERDELEVRIGKVKILFALMRLSPKLAERIMRKL